MMLKDKVALVTGSTSGIGLAVAERLAAEGAHIVLNGFGDADDIAALRKRLMNDYSVKVIHSDADMSKADQIDMMFEQIGEKFAGVDVLVNNVGIQHVAPIEDFPTQKWDAIMAINLSSAFHTTRNVIPHMRKQGWGRIINIASAHGLVASANKVAYVAAKHGIVGMTKVAALELAESGVTCNAICPGWVRTPLVEQQIEKRAKENGITVEEATDAMLREKHPSMRFVMPEEVGGMAVYLCSKDAGNVTGAQFSIDGGWTAQ